MTKGLRHEAKLKLAGGQVTGIGATMATRGENVVAIFGRTVPERKPTITLLAKQIVEIPTTKKLYLLGSPQIKITTSRQTHVMATHTNAHPPVQMAPAPLAVVCASRALLCDFPSP